MSDAETLTQANECMTLAKDIDATCEICNSMIFIKIRKYEAVVFESLKECIAYMKGYKLGLDK